MEHRANYATATFAVIVAVSTANVLIFQPVEEGGISHAEVSALLQQTPLGKSKVDRRLQCVSAIDR